MAERESDTTVIKLSSWLLKSSNDFLMAWISDEKMLEKSVNFQEFWMLSLGIKKAGDVY